MKKLFVILSVGILMLTSSSIFAENPRNNQLDQDDPKSFTVWGIKHALEPGDKGETEIWCWYSVWIKCVTIHTGKTQGFDITTYDKDGRVDSKFKVKDYQVVPEKDKTIVKVFK